MSGALAPTRSSQLTIQLRDRIVAGTYAPGSQLLQDSIAAEFGVSKIPVREALVQLQGEGLVDIYAYRGFQVRPISAQDMEEVFRLRLSIEPDAVAAGAQKADDADQRAAKSALDQLNNAVSQDDLSASGNLNRAFHLALIVPHGHPVVADILGRLHTFSQRYIQMHLSPRGRVKRAIGEHKELYAAWEKRKASKVADLTRAHIDATRKDLARAIRASGH